MSTLQISKPLPVTDTLRIIYERRAVRKYKEKPLQKRLIEQLIDAGTMAPSAMNMSPGSFMY